MYIHNEFPGVFLFQRQKEGVLVQKDTNSEITSSKIWLWNRERQRRPGKDSEIITRALGEDYLKMFHITAGGHLYQEGIGPNKNTSKN